jgi:hypothetical protein
MGRRRQSETGHGLVPTAVSATDLCASGESGVRGISLIECAWSVVADPAVTTRSGRVSARTSPAGRTLIPRH